MNRVPSTGDDRERSVYDSDTHLAGNPDVLSIKSTGYQQNGYVDFAESLPVRRLGALSHASEAVSESDGAIAKPNFALRTGNLIWERSLAFPDREPLPVSDERLDPSLFDSPRHDPIRFCSLVSFALIVNTSGGAHQHQRGDPVRVIEGHPECQPAT
jgi:hypothetical protein